MKFMKMHGLGNDFVILDLRDGTPLPPRDTIARLTHRKTGIGCDQFIPLLPPRHEEADVYMMILNAPDASEAEACGNATRCVAALLMDEKGTEKAVIQTIAGLLYAWREDDGRITVDMGAPKFGWEDIPLTQACDTLNMGIGEGAAQNPVGVNVGNPHGVFFIGNVEDFPVREIGPILEHHKIFKNKANIEFVEILNPKEMRMRVWERDTGETDACGSAACATHVAAVRRGLAERKARVHLNGGFLDFHWREEDDHILMTGPATYVFEGVMKLDHR